MENNDDTDLELSEEARKTLHELLEYAESLGIVERLSLNGDTFDAQHTAKSPVEQQYYKYLIVVDFESTCWDDKTARSRHPEIIGKHYFSIFIAFSLQQLKFC